MNSIKNKKQTFLITGASSGIGQKIAIELSKLNINLIVNGKSKIKLKKTFSSLKGTRNFSFPADLNSENIFFELEKFCKAKKINLDGVIHCAGIHNFSPLKLISYESFENVYKTNVYSFINLTKFFSTTKYRNKNGGNIVCLSSVSSYEGNKSISLYSSSKASLNNLVKCYAKELAAKKIRVNSIVLGHIQEGMGLRVKEKLTEDQLNNLENRHPLGFGDVNDVLNGIKFLTSPESKWITGSNIVIDGGYLA